MSHEPDQGGNARKLTDAEARRILARATEIDAARSGGVSIADLREAAGEAGIEADAFDQAMVELRGHTPAAQAEPPKPAVPIRRRLRRMVFETVKIAAIVVVILSVFVVLVDWIG